MALVRSRNHEKCGNDEEWMRMIDGGGLYMWYIKESTYFLSLAIEEETRQYFQPAFKMQARNCKDDFE